MRNTEILLAKRAAGLLEAGKWCLLGGYVDRDETTAQAIEREVMEESGWEITNLRLLRINDNPNRPHEDRQNIDFIFVAEAVKKTGEKDWESDEVKWYPLDALPPHQEIAFDHSESIDLYRRYIQNDFGLVEPGDYPIV